jgi:DNA-binding transcriptional ArsR family regulator
MDSPGDLHPDVAAILGEVGVRGRWDADDVQALSGLAQGLGWRGKSAAEVKRIIQLNLDLYADLEGSGQAMLSALEAYQEQFFAEEEQRIRPYLESALRQAQALAARMSLLELLEEMSQGVRVVEVRDELVLVPSFWTTPKLTFAHVSKDRDLYLYGARPSGVSLIPGDEVPDALFQALKALADPTRLRILRYLTDEPQTPAQLARRLRLRPPTVIHHLDALRLARLVHITLTEEGKQYAARPGAVDSTFVLLDEFLTSEGEGEGEDVPGGAGGDTDFA